MGRRSTKMFYGVELVHQLFYNVHLVHQRNYNSAISNGSEKAQLTSGVEGSTRAYTRQLNFCTTDWCLVSNWNVRTFYVLSDRCVSYFIFYTKASCVDKLGEGPRRCSTTEVYKLFTSTMWTQYTNVITTLLFPTEVKRPNWSVRTIYVYNVDLVHQRNYYSAISNGSGKAQLKCADHLRIVRPLCILFHLLYKDFVH